MTSEIVGREEELAAVDAFLDAPRDGPAALVLEGSAGIGKSTLWLAALERARARGLGVLSTRPAEAEQDLAFAGLGDLLEDVLEDFAPSLPSPRRRALEGALLLGGTSGRVDPRALGVAVRSALEILAAGPSPLVLAVDDVQWLDRSSTSALSFALRRLDEPILLLLGRRVGTGIEQSELGRALPHVSAELLHVGSLSLGAIQCLLQERLSRAFPRPTLLRIHEISGGNPFYALEVGRALGPDIDPTRPLPVPATLDELVAARLAGLPDHARVGLGLVAAAGHPSWALLRAAGVEPEALDLAYTADVLESRDGEPRFAHPLLASAFYQRLLPGQRRETHRVLAGLVDEPVERARHLALSTEQPDSEVAAALEQASDVAAARGATAAAIELDEHALRLTPREEEDDAHRRMIALARAHQAAGNVHRADALVRDLLRRVGAGARRAEALVLAADVRTGSWESISLLREALDEAAGSPALQAGIHARLGWDLRLTEGLAVAERHAEAALELAETLGDAGPTALALATVAANHLHLGLGDAFELAERAHALAATLDDAATLAEVTLSVSGTCMWTGHHGRARTLLEPFYADWSERDEEVAGQALWRLGLVEFFAGRFVLAADHERRALEIDTLYGESVDRTAVLWAVALVAAYRGDLDEAGRLAKDGRRLAEDTPWFIPRNETMLGLVALWSGDPRGACDHFAKAEIANAEVGSREPFLAWWRTHQVEALLELGRLDEAAALLAAWEQDARRLGRDWVLAEARRCHGLLAAARGAIDEAESLLELAAAEHEEVGDRFGRARALLALGAVHRRSRRKRAAREAIEESLALFEECGAEGWADKARAELGGIGGRRREEGLTAAERRVASLVAEGRTNREVATALFLAERTVQAHLTRIYAKLGVRSRTELARAYERTP